MSEAVLGEDGIAKVTEQGVDSCGREHDLGSTTDLGVKSEDLERWPARLRAGWD